MKPLYLLLLLGLSQTINNPVFLTYHNPLEKNEPVSGKDIFVEELLSALNENGLYSISFGNTLNNFQSQNPRNDIYITYSPHGFEIKNNPDEWNIGFKIAGFGRIGEIFNIADISPEFTVDHNQLVYHFPQMDVQYINSPSGMRQNFILHEKPEGEGTLNILLKVNTNDLEISCNEKLLSAKQKDQLKYTYSDLIVWDANHQTVSAHMQLEYDILALVVDDAQAIYPLTIDPVSSVPDATIEGEQAESFFGDEVADAGDVNGDGFDDIMVSAPSFDNGHVNEGRVYIYHGSATGINTTPAITLESNQTFAFFGGSAIAGAGDINSDGFDDVLIGASSYDNGQTDEGRVFVYHGSPAGISGTPAITFENNQASSSMGTHVAGAGDVNNDGYDDVIFSANRFDNGQTDEGRVYVHHGSATGLNPIPSVTLEPNVASSLFGYGLNGAGDINADGFDDIIVGAYNQSNGQSTEGLTYIYHGSASGINPVAATTLEINQSTANFGQSVDGAGDINADGYDDVIIGAPSFSNGESNEGRAYIYHGSAAGIITPATKIIEINEKNADYGTSVSGIGDINADGFDDLMVGADNFDGTGNDVGAVFIYQGSAAGISDVPVLILSSDQSNVYFGSSTSPAGDVNNDGYDDIIISADWYDTDLTNAGIVNIYHGYDCALELLYIDADNDGFGSPDFFINGCSDTYGYVDNTLDCDDSKALINPNTFWYLDVDGDRYYSDLVTGINQCISPGDDYTHFPFGEGDCDDDNYYINPGIIEFLNGMDDNCDGLIETYVYSETILESNVASAGLGSSVASAGDVNGDGYGDIIAGAPSYANGEPTEGAAYIYMGTESGINATPVVLEYNHIYAQFGSSVAGAGDVNNDGYDDVIVGAKYYENGQDIEGAAFIFHGSALGISAVPSLMIESNNIGAQFGCSVSSAGDVNSDGFDDVIIGASAYSNGQYHEGRIFVYHGSASGINPMPAFIYELNQTGTNLGLCVASAGDVNGDGYDDIITGASQYDNPISAEGAFIIFHGSASGIIPLPATFIEGNTEVTYLGLVVAKCGDVNGDGFDDIMVNSKSDTGGSSNVRISIYHGSASGINITPAITWEDLSAIFFAYTFSSAGDLNSDGYDDIINVATDYFNIEEVFTGRIYIHFGSASGINATSDYIIQGTDNDNFGVSVASAGDINNDGLPDFLVGDNAYDNPSYGEGAVYVYLACNEEIYFDADGDGFGDPLSTTFSCVSPAGYVVNNSDCNDANNLISPEATELCNTIDDDCDAIIDEDIVESITITAAGPTTFCQGNSVVLNATYTGTTIQWKKNGVNIPGATTSSLTVGANGTYRAETTSACDADLSTGIEVIVNKNPPASITADGATTFCAGGSVILTANSGAGLSYQWYTGASLIAGATLINYTATTAGNYKCRVTKTATGCFKNSNTIAVSVPCREGDELFSENDNSFSIYPNPNTGTFSLITESRTGATSPLEGRERGVRYLEIYNPLGQLIYSQEINSVDGKINEVIEINNLSSGIYFVQLSNGDIQFEEKLIIE